MADAITIRVTYTPPTGVLADPIVFESKPEDGLSLVYGVRGLGVAPVEHTTEKRAQGHGSILRDTRMGEREIFLPVLLDGASVAEVDNFRDTLVASCNPLHGPGTITVERIADGQKRSIPAIYKDGLDGDYSESYYGVWHAFGFTFLATEAFWNGEEQLAEWSLKTTDKTFISNTVSFFPVILSSSTISGSYRFNIQGVTEVAPTWRITGPATDVTVKNITTRQSFTLAGEIKPGETVTVDTANNVLQASDRTEDDLWDNSLSLDSTLFTLPSGENLVAVTATGLTDASKVEAFYHEKYFTGY